MLGITLKNISANFTDCRWNERGFTLIELLVAIGIFTLLSSFLVVKYRGNETIRTLKNQALEAVAGLQRAQNMSLTGETAGGGSPSNYVFAIADCSADCAYSLSAFFPDNSSLEISRSALKNVAVKTFQPGGLRIDFSPPRGNMAISPGNLNTAAFEIYNAQAAYCVKLNSVSGRIDLVSGTCP